ncbi:hypothetical protein [uncultured Nostoc sp.]|uniref:hypothetical protein n=1 Tax=uncultured Nostoc sp. TaxID=340711 RepID=UPI0035CA16F8
MLNTKEYFKQIDATLAFKELDNETAASDSLIEDISDDKSASVAGGAVKDFSGTLNGGFGILPTLYKTTSKFNDISIRLTKNPYDLYVYAPRPSGGQVNTYDRFIPANYRGVITVAANVKDGTSFRLGFYSPSFATFKIAGRTTF